MASVLDLVKAMDKSYGKGVVQPRVAASVVERLPTGVMALDVRMGGGIPRGRVSIFYGLESSGKTTLALKSIAMHQYLFPDKKCVFVDIEGTYDPGWGKLLGVNNDELVYVLPDYAEQAVDIIEELIYAEDIGLIVVDSLAAFITNNEIISSAEKAVVGGSGLVIGRLYRKTTLALSKAKISGHTPTIIMINQVRYKIGVMFGDPECLHYDTVINFVDGSSLPIGKVVEDKVFGKVWGLDLKSNIPVPVDILSHHFNGVAEDRDFFTIKVQGLDTKNGVSSATTTYTHKYWSQGSWKSLMELEVGDDLVTRIEDPINGLLKDFLDGSLCGDVVRVRPNNQSNTALVYQDKINHDYAEWKFNLIGEFLGKVIWKGRFKTKPSYAITKYCSLYEGRDPQRILDNFTWLGFSIWMMDDGHLDLKDGHCRYILSVKRFKGSTKLLRIADKLGSMGMGNVVKKDGAIVFTSYATRYISRKICKYVPECMSYKILKVDFCLGQNLRLDCQVKVVSQEVKVLSIEPAKDRKYRKRGLYDINVSGDNSYMVGNVDNGFVVHNTMPGGSMFKFASSMTLRLSAKDIMDPKVHGTLPAWKKFWGTIKKWKVPITGKTFETKISLLPSTGFPIGASDNWKFVSALLLENGVIKKDPKSGYVLDGEHYKTLGAIRQRYLEEVEVAQVLDSLILDLEFKGTGLSNDGES